jgi:hypothetical protein
VCVSARCSKAASIQSIFKLPPPDVVQDMNIDTNYKTLASPFTHGIKEQTNAAEVGGGFNQFTGNIQLSQNKVCVVAGFNSTSLMMDLVQHVDFKVRCTCNICSSTIAHLTGYDPNKVRATHTAYRHQVHRVLFGTL